MAPIAYESYHTLQSSLQRESGVSYITRYSLNNCLFCRYEQLKKFFTNGGQRELDTVTRLSSGALAGITSVCKLLACVSFVLC